VEEEEGGGQIRRRMATEGWPLVQIRPSQASFAAELTSLRRRLSPLGRLPCEEWVKVTPPPSLPALRIVAMVSFGGCMTRMGKREGGGTCISVLLFFSLAKKKKRILSSTFIKLDDVDAPNIDHLHNACALLFFLS
jgi:hypothetical protein